MAKAYPLVAPMRELRSALSDLRLNDLAVGQDGRNRTILSAFRSRTGRNQPSNTKFHFRPERVAARADQAAARSMASPTLIGRSRNSALPPPCPAIVAMQAAYRSGDPYLAFAKQAGAVPPDATKQTHGPTRELFKQCVLAVQYGMEAESLAARIGQPPVVARDLLRAHRETYRKFWRWSDAAVDHAMLTGSLHTVFGWHVHVGENPNPRSLRNFPMQANGAEMLRLACCLATERGIEVCAPVHDAVLICAPLDRLDDDIAACARPWPKHRRSCSAALSSAPMCTPSVPRPLHGHPRRRDVGPGDRPNQQATASRNRKRGGGGMSDDPFDLGSFALTPGQLAELAPLQKKPELKPRSMRSARSARPAGARFVQLPYERTLAAAGRHRDARLAVLIELAYRTFKANQNQVPLANKTLRSVGITHKAKARALRQLEAAGLVTITRRGSGKSPLVTILWK